MKKNDSSLDQNKYLDIIESLKNELEGLKHELAVKTYNQNLLRLQEDLIAQNTKIEKLSKEITSHFQEELRMKKEIMENERIIDNLNQNLKEKNFQLFKISSQKSKNILKDKKDINSQMNRLNEQINLQNSIMISKEKQYEELVKKREYFESQIAKYSKDKNGMCLQYLYHCFIFEINNLTNEHIRRRDLNVLRQKEMKINKLLEQIKIRDEYIDIEKKELQKKKIKFNYDQENLIKKVEDLHIDKNLNLPMLIQQQDVPINVNVPSPHKNISNINSNNIISNSNNLNVSDNGGNRYDYSGYRNPNIVKDKQVFNTKTNAILSKCKKNELSQLRLNILNDLYKNSKVVYVNNVNRNDYGNESNVITFDAKCLNKSQSNASLKSHNNSFNNGNDSRNNIEDREIDYRIKKIMDKKKWISPYIKK